MRISPVLAAEHNQMGSKPADTPHLEAALYGELIDAVDEELELEIDDDRLRDLLNHTYRQQHVDALDRRFYFQELLRLQEELTMTS